MPSVEHETIRLIFWHTNVRNISGLFHCSGMDKSGIDFRPNVPLKGGARRAILTPRVSRPSHPLFYETLITLLRFALTFALSLLRTGRARTPIASHSKPCSARTGPRWSAIRGTVDHLLELQQSARGKGRNRSALVRRE